VKQYFRQQCDPPIYSTDFKGLIRDQKVTSRLIPFRQKQSLLNMPSVEQVLSKFIAGQETKRAFIAQGLRIPILTTVPIPPAAIRKTGDGKGIIGLGNLRVSTTPQATEGGGLGDQDAGVVGHVFIHHVDEQHTIPVEGFLCFYEACGAYNSIPETLIYLLNHPKLAVCNDEGQCIAFNTIYYLYAERVIRHVENFKRIKGVLDERRINIWCIKEAKGSLTDSDDFMDLIRIAQLSAESMGFKAECAWKRPDRKISKGKCIRLNRWNVLDNERLKVFLDREKIPPSYRIKTGHTFSINWVALTKAEFPGLETEEVRRQYRHLEKKEQRRLKFNTNTHKE
jgi:hypothetical protein